MDKENYWVAGLLARYLILLALGLFNLGIFYLIFTPLTIYPVYWITLLLDPNARLLPGNLVFFSGEYAEIIAACIAGAALYLLTILNLSTPMRITSRLRSLAFLYFSFLAINISRIVIFLAFFVAGKQYFDIAHKFVWYFGSTVIVVALWFINVWIYKLKEIPIYSDVKEVIDRLKNTEEKGLNTVIF